MTARVNWRFGLPLALRVQGVPPAASRSEVQQALAQMRLAGHQMGAVARDVSSLPGTPASRVLVVDRPGWVRGVTQLVDDVVDAMPTPSRWPGIASWSVGTAGGLVVGLVSRKILGQYNPFSAPSTLYLVAPNLFALARRITSDTEQFYRWVAAHEQTHAIQISSAPWLRGYVMEQFHLLATRGATGQRLAEVMTVMEGHADFIADRVGQAHIPSAQQFRDVFSRSHTTAPGWWRLVSAANKPQQYLRGLQFCQQVVQLASIEELNAVFTSPETLPSEQEISHPQRWLERVHG